MTHKHRNKQIQRTKKRYKNLAGIVAAATLLSTATLPGIPAAIAHASTSANAGNMSATTSQQTAKTSDSGIQINFNSTVLPANELNAQNKKPEPVKEVKQESKASPTKSDVSKAPAAVPTPLTQANPNAQPDPNAGKAPVTAPTPLQQANPNAQPDPNAGKAPVTTPTPLQQANPNAQPDPNAGKAPAAAPTPLTQANPNAQSDPNVITTSANNAPTDYKQVLDIKATAYAPGPHDNGKWGNKTHIGTQVRPGIIAVDPNVIPLGSRVYIQYPDGHGEYAVAEDTGGAIKGNRVDIAKWTVDEAYDFGVQNVKVYVVSTPEKV